MHDFARNYLAQAHQAIKVFMFDIARKHCETGLRYAKKSPISPIKSPILPLKETASRFCGAQVAKRALHAPERSPM